MKIICAHCGRQNTLRSVGEIEKRGRFQQIVLEIAARKQSRFTARDIQLELGLEARTAGSLAGTLYHLAEFGELRRIRDGGRTYYEMAA